MEKPSLADATAPSSTQAIPLPGIWLVAFFAAITVYGATVAPDVLMMDSGEYQRQTWLFPQVEQPGGLGNLVRVHYNYLLLAKGFGLLFPFGQWALRINLFSALAASLAVANACTLTWCLTRSKPATVLAWLTLTLGQTFWQYAVIAEVLSLQAATLSAELLVLYLWTTSDKYRWLLALWAINGFAAGVHIQNGLASPVYLVITVLAWRRSQVSLRQAVLCGAVWLAGFAPFLVYCLRQLGSHWDTLSSMTVGIYGGSILQAQPRVLLRGLMAIGLNYPTGLVLLAIPGLFVLARRAPASRTFAWGWMGVILANFVFAMTYKVPDQQSFFVPLYAAIAPLIGLGAAWTLGNPFDRAWAFILALLVVPIYAVLPDIARTPAIAKYLPMPGASEIEYRDPYEFYLVPWKTGRHNERRYIEEVFDALAPSAAFYCGSTAADGLRTVQVIENKRTDVVINPPLDVLAERIRPGAWDKPVYLCAPGGSAVPKALVEHCRLIKRGLVWEVVAPDDPEGLRRDLFSAGR